MIILFKTIEKNSIAICFVSRWRPHTLFSSVVFPESCKPTSPETNVWTNLFDQTIGVVGVPIKHSLTRMHRILWTASMHAILRRMLSLLSSVLFSIPLPRKFSIPRSLEIALQSGLNLVVNLTCQTWEAGLFLCCRCCRRLLGQRLSALVRGLPVRQDVMAEKKKSSSNKPLSSHSWTH